MSKKTSKTKSRVVVAMSGGVDSSVAAYLLKKQGYDVIGIFLKFWMPPEDRCGKKKENTCCNLESLAMARQVAEKLEIPFYVIHAEEYFKEKIVDYFIKEYEQGRTPNPCVFCNKSIKFGFLWKKAQELGAEYLATGHYIRLESVPKSKRKKCTSENSQIVKLLNCQDQNSNLAIYQFNNVISRPKDSAKDQTYFLSHITPEVIPHLLFPLADLEKKEVRVIAKKAGLPVFSKKDSMGVCFIPDGDNARFLAQYSKKLNKPGDIVDKYENVLGRHEGLMGYTLGEKVGNSVLSAKYFRINVGATGSVAQKTGRTSGSPLRVPAIPRLYVTRIDVKKNLLIIGENEDCFADTLVAENIHILNNKIFDLAKEGKEIYAQIRGGHKAEKGKIVKLLNCQDQNSNLAIYQFNNKKSFDTEKHSKIKDDCKDLVMTLKFSKPVRAITPGQVVAFYDGETLLGGGTIVEGK